MSYKRFLNDFATQELELSGFLNTDFGKSCLDLLNKCSDFCNEDPHSMKTVLEILPKLIDKMPLSPITEEDEFREEDYSNGENKHIIKRCVRYPQLYQDMNGKYYDEKAIVFISTVGTDIHKSYLYQKKYNSKKEVTLPYFPQQEEVLIQE